MGVMVKRVSKKRRRKDRAAAKELHRQRQISYRHGRKPKKRRW